MRIRFTSPHPKDFPDEVLAVVKDRPNVCKSLHMPAQSGSTSVLHRMRRGYSREAYLNLIQKVKATIPGCSISSDFISGFCGETEEEHRETISLLEEVQYAQAFMFAYSLREKTHAHRNYLDDIPQNEKLRRLGEVIATFTRIALLNNKAELSKEYLVLVEGVSKRSKDELFGRTDANKKVFFPKTFTASNNVSISLQPGDYAVVQITGCSSHSLQGGVLEKTTLMNHAEKYLHSKGGHLQTL